MKKILTSHDIGRLLASDEYFMHILSCVDTISPQPWCIFGGQLRNVIWDEINDCSSPQRSKDVDVAVFSPDDPALFMSLSRLLNDQHPGIKWDVVDFAQSHIENLDDPYLSLDDGLACQLMTVMSVGATLDEGRKLRLIAPLGTSDLRECIVRPTPIILARPERKQLIRDVIMKKQWEEKWPTLQICL